MRVGVVGSGRVGQVHARNLAAHRDVEKLLIGDPDRERATALATEVDGVALHDLDEILERGVDAAVIAAPTSLHPDLIRRCVDAGVPAFCEKPIALTLDETTAVVDHVRATGVPVQMGFQRRFDPGYQEARRRIENGSLGRVYAFRIAAQDPAPPPPGYLEVSGSIFRDLHIHDFDVIRFLFDAEVEEVYAAGSVLVSEEFARHGDVDTSAFLLRLTDGTLGAATGGRNNPAGYDIRMDLHGSRDSISVGLSEQTPIASVEPGMRPFAGPASPDFVHRFAAGYRAEIDHFLDLARGQADNRCTVEDAYEALRIAVAADLSLSEHRPVRLEEVR